jgi:group I intron endonuclease
MEHINKMLQMPGARGIGQYLKKDLLIIRYRPPNQPKKPGTLYGVVDYFLIRKVDQGEIYCITNTETGERYIGQTTCMKKRDGRLVPLGADHRFKQHVKNAMSDSPERKTACRKLYKAIRRYGEERFKLDVLETCGLKDLNQKERYYIRKYDSIKGGYNIARGGKPRPKTGRQLARYRERKREREQRKQEQQTP